MEIRSRSVSLGLTQSHQDHLTLNISYRTTRPRIHCGKMVHLNSFRISSTRILRKIYWGSTQLSWRTQVAVYIFAQPSCSLNTDIQLLSDLVPYLPSPTITFSQLLIETRMELTALWNLHEQKLIESAVLSWPRRPSFIALPHFTWKPRFPESGPHKGEAILLNTLKDVSEFTMKEKTYTDKRLQILYYSVKTFKPSPASHKYWSHYLVKCPKAVHWNSRLRDFTRKI